MTALQKKRLRKVLFATLCLTLILALGTVFCFATDATDVDGEAIMSEIVSILTSGITDFGVGLAGGINGYVKALFISSSGGLSTTGVVIVVFAAIAIVTGITALVWNWISTLGARK
jgi:hypothetical protein